MRNYQLPGRSTIHSQQGMVATSHPLASNVGIGILKKGGNAVDAAIAMALVLPLCEPQSTGFFGDVFALIKPSGSNSIIGLNGSGKSPENLTSSSIRSKGHVCMPNADVCSITLPGAIAAFDSLHKKFGKLDLSDLCEPAIFYAENGVVVSPRVAFDWSYSASALKGAARGFYLNRDKPFKVGEVFFAPGQAKMLSEFSKKGAAGFYEGEIADDLIVSLQNLGGTHSFEDLDNVQAEYVNPITAQLGDYELVEMPPNGQGVTAILIRKILEQFDLKNLNPIGAERVHLEAEAAKIAYSARNKLIADPNFYKFPIEEFISDEIISNYVAKINPNKARDQEIQTRENPHKDTVYLTVIDENRCMVSLIFSIFNSFGSGYSSEKFGLLFHNRGAGFSLEKGHPNELAGGKRPLHTIIPGFLKKKNEFTMPFGVMGGQYQANGHARLISNIIDHGMDIQTAIDFPRSFPEAGHLKLEDGYSSSIAAELKNKGHNILRPDNPIGGAQAIIFNHVTGTLTGGSDPRKDGCALGY